MYIGKDWRKQFNGREVDRIEFAKGINGIVPRNVDGSSTPYVSHGLDQYTERVLNQ